MEKIIINSEIKEPLKYVQKVINGGLISGTNSCYCYHTLFNDGVHVTCKKIKTGFSFMVFR